MLLVALRKVGVTQLTDGQEKLKRRAPPLIEMIEEVDTIVVVVVPVIMIVIVISEDVIIMTATESTTKIVITTETKKKVKNVNALNLIYFPVQWIIPLAQLPIKEHPRVILLVVPDLVMKLPS
jgi:hypothetical protein